MKARNTKSGGIFLTIGMLGGMVGGVAIGKPMVGVLAGTVLGAVCALLLWLVDRRR